MEPELEAAAAVGPAWEAGGVLEPEMEAPATVDPFLDPELLGSGVRLLGSGARLLGSGAERLSL